LKEMNDISRCLKMSTHKIQKLRGERLKGTENNSDVVPPHTVQGLGAAGGKADINIQGKKGTCE